MKDDGGPAFPLYADGKGICADDVSIGMTLRDYFAAKALQGLMGAADGFYTHEHKARAEICYKTADAMLTARKI